MICPNCQKAIPDDSSFCPFCGQYLESPQAESNIIENLLVGNNQDNAENSTSSIDNTISGPTTRSITNSTKSQPRRLGYVLMGILIAIVVIIFIFVPDWNSVSRASSSAKKPTITSKPTYSITLDKQEGFGGTSSVYPSEGEAMPSAKAPSKNGYDFKGYFSSPNGKGTMYYDNNMISSHAWDITNDSTLYAYWVKKQEKKYSSSVSEEDLVYVDIVSIFPTYGIYSDSLYNRSFDYSHFVCECKTSTGSTVWVYISADEYISKFDSSVNKNRLAFSNNATTVSFSSSKRIHGTVIRASSITDDLSSTTGVYIIEFSSVK